MPEETIRAFQDHGRVEVRLESDLDEARCLFNQLYTAGVDNDGVVAILEREGSEKFFASSDDLLNGIAEKRLRTPRLPVTTREAKSSAAPRSRVRSASFASVPPRAGAACGQLRSQRPDP
jgi:hypothetical protein